MARLPNGAISSGAVQLLAMPALEAFWPRYSKMLETTRRRVLDHRCREWKKHQKKQRIPGKQKRAMEATLTPTTVFDFLWRLRVRSNYQDVETILMSKVSHDWHISFYSSLRSIVDSTCLLFESLVVRKNGPSGYEAAVNDFIGDGPGRQDHPAEFLRGRRDAILGPRQERP